MIILIAYFVVGISICYKMNPEKTILQIVENYFGLILSYVIMSFIANFFITIIIRYLQDVMVKYLVQRIELQEEFENILRNLEEGVISIEDINNIKYCNVQGMDIMTNALLFLENKLRLDSHRNSNNIDQLNLNRSQQYKLLTQCFKYYRHDFYKLLKLKNKTEE